ncbi:MAG: metallophosphoesterase [Candidatus Omnitrophica bacterium]|nr:metallophosphoesterase [Candidatus Omnitrophota bacterium]
MKIVVLADTHIPMTTKSLPAAIFKDINDADLILHAGDIVEVEALKELEKIKPVIAVAGNMDSEKTKRLLHTKKTLHLEGFKIGLIHGEGSPESLINFVKNEFRNIKNLSCIIYGHSHIPSIKKEGGIIYFNPGSPTDKVFAPYNSYGVLDVGEDGIIPRIVKI